MRLARVRAARGFTQAELGAVIGLSQRMVAYYEAQSERPPAHVLPQLAQALQISLDELLGLKPAKAAPAPRNTRLWRRLRQVEALPAVDQKAVVNFVEALVARRKLEQRG